MNLFSRIGTALKTAVTGRLPMSASSGGFEGAMSKRRLSPTPPVRWVDRPFAVAAFGKRDAPAFKDRNRRDGQCCAVRD